MSDSDLKMGHPVDYSLDILQHKKVTVLHLRFFRVIGAIGGNEEASHVNLHHLIMTLLLCTPHFQSDKERLEAIVSTLAYVDMDVTPRTL